MTEQTLADRDAWREKGPTERRGGFGRGSLPSSEIESWRSFADAAREHLAAALAHQLKALQRSQAAEQAVPHAVPSWMAEIQDTLFRLGEDCRDDDWDSDGARGLKESTRRYAIKFALQVPATVPKPDVEVDPEGRITFDWQFRRDLVFAVSVDADGQLYFAGLYGNTRNSGMETIGDELPSTIAANFRKLAQGLGAADRAETATE